MPLTNGNHEKPAPQSTILEFRHRLERIESAVKPLESINLTLGNINDTLKDIKLILAGVSNQFFKTLCWALKYLGIGVFIIILLAMGFKEFGQFLK